MMRFVLWALLLLLVPASPAQTARAAAPADGTPGWQKDMAARHEALIQANGPGTNVELRTQLLSMGLQDQEARGMMNGQPTDKNRYTPAENVAAVDTQLTAQLKDLVGKNGWPTIALVGYEASKAALLILIHTQDHEWQRSLLPQLETLADTGKIDGSSVATLVDKELISEGKLQRYGTQYKSLGDHMAMFAVEDPAALDARRAKVFLPPMAVYEQKMSEMYHMSVSKQIVMAGTPAASQPNSGKSGSLK